MSNLVFVSFESEIELFDFPSNFEPIGDTIVEEVAILDQIANQSNVIPLSQFQFVGFSSEDSSVDDLNEEDWFSSAEGLRTVETLLTFLSGERAAIKEKSTARHVRRIKHYRHKFLVEELTSVRERLRRAIEKYQSVKFVLTPF